MLLHTRMILSGRFTARMKKRLALQSLQVLNDTVTVLAMKGWEKSEDTSFGHGAVERLAEQFQKPLEKSGIDCSQLQQEWDDILLYGWRYLNLTSEDYKCLWWKLFNSVDSGTWANILGLVELLFCLPAANGRVERMFSHLRIIKTGQPHLLQ